MMQSLKPVKVTFGEPPGLRIYPGTPLGTSCARKASRSRTRTCAARSRATRTSPPGVLPVPRDGLPRPAHPDPALVRLLAPSRCCTVTRLAMGVSAASPAEWASGGGGEWATNAVPVYSCSYTPCFGIRPSLFQYEYEPRSPTRPLTPSPISTPRRRFAKNRTKLTIIYWRTWRGGAV